MWPAGAMLDRGLTTAYRRTRPITSTRSCPAFSAGPDGALYFSLRFFNHHIIRRIRPDGFIDTVGGVKGAADGFNGDGHPARFGLLDDPGTPVIGPDGALYVADRENHRVRRIAPSIEGFTGQTIAFASTDGTALYRFTVGGRHLETVSTYTGARLVGFGYDDGGRLTTVTDGDGNVTTIERTGTGTPVAIVGPHG